MNKTVILEPEDLAGLLSPKPSPPNNVRKRDLVVFGEDWGGLPSSTQHLIRHLAKDRKVLWVNSIGLRSPRFCAHDIKRIVIKFGYFVRQAFTNKTKNTKTKGSPHNIFVIKPLSIPAPSSQLARKISARLLKLQIEPYIKRLNLYDPILWSSLPTTSDLPPLLPTRSLVYYCGDDFSGLAGVDNQVVAHHEEKLAENADLVIAASKHLAAKFAPHKTRELLHGVDFNLFSTPVTRASDLPKRSRPTAGFYGSLSQWLDTDLLATVIEKLPNWNFVFIGKESIDLSPLKAYKNTFFLGAKEHAVLPRYSQHWDVSLLPFRDNEQIRACNPLKLLEYLAVGKPIVATRFPAAEYHKGVIQCANTPDDFIAAMKLGYQAATLPFFSHALQSRIGNNTWEEKSRQVSQWLDAL